MNTDLSMLVFCQFLNENFISTKSRWLGSTNKLLIFIGLDFSCKFGPTNPIVLFLTVGFLGSFTTFSSFSFETLNLFLADQSFLAVINIILNVVLCISFVSLGMYVGKLFFLG